MDRDEIAGIIARTLAAKGYGTFTFQDYLEVTDKILAEIGEKQESKYPTMNIYAKPGDKH